MRCLTHFTIRAHYELIFLEITVFLFVSLLFADQKKTLAKYLHFAVFLNVMLQNCFFKLFLFSGEDFLVDSYLF